MTRREALIELRDKVKAGEALQAVDAVDAFPMTPDGDVAWLHACKASQGSIDAAKALHKAVLPPINQYTIVECIWPDGLSGERELQFKGLAETPARAWLLAILEVLINKETHK